MYIHRLKYIQKRSGKGLEYTSPTTSIPLQNKHAGILTPIRNKDILSNVNHSRHRRPDINVPNTKKFVIYKGRQERTFTLRHTSYQIHL